MPANGRWDLIRRLKVKLKNLHIYYSIFHLLLHRKSRHSPLQTFVCYFCLRSKILLTLKKICLYHVGKMQIFLDFQASGIYSMGLGLEN